MDVDFDPAAFQRAVDDIHDGVLTARGHVAGIPAAADAALASSPLPDEVRTMIVWCAERTVEVATDLLDRVVEALEGAAAPVWFFDHAMRWQDLRGTTSGAAAALNPALLPSVSAWSGKAATAYQRAGGPQRDAATKIGSIADRTSWALGLSAVAGAAFYVTVGIIVVKLVAALVAVIAAFGSEVFAPAGILLVVEETVSDTSVLVAAGGALVTALATQAQQMAVLHGEAVDNTSFPNGRWPDPITATYTDATVTDGDADWSLAR